MTLTPEGEIKKAQLIAIYGWFRRNLVLAIVAAMLLFQFLNWRALDRLADSMPRNPPKCSEYDPCSVYVKGTVELAPYSIRSLSK